MFFVTVIIIYITYIFYLFEDDYLLLLLLVSLLLLSLLIKNINFFHLHFQFNVLTLNRSRRTMLLVNFIKGTADFVVYILYVFLAEVFHWCTGCGGDEILCSTWWTVAVIFN